MKILKVWNLIPDIGILYIYTAAIQNNRPKSIAYLDDFFMWQDILTKFGRDYSLKQRFHLRTYCSNRNPIA